MAEYQRLWSRMSAGDHADEAQRLTALALEQYESAQPLYRLTMQQAQVHATLAVGHMVDRVDDTLRELLRDAPWRS